MFTEHPPNDSANVFIFVIFLNNESLLFTGRLPHILLNVMIDTSPLQQALTFAVPGNIPHSQN
jgi:hypothetical protein